MNKVLVIDDCQEIREVISQLLGEEGYLVTEAAGPEIAKDLLAKNNFDVILCDLVMPIEDGQECAIVGVKAITEISRSCPQTPVIAISGELTGTPLNEISAFGARCALSKPFSREELLSKVASVMPAR